MFEKYKKNAKFYILLSSSMSTMLSYLQIAYLDNVIIIFAVGYKLFVLCCSVQFNQVELIIGHTDKNKRNSRKEKQLE